LFARRLPRQQHQRTGQCNRSRAVWVPLERALALAQQNGQPHGIQFSKVLYYTYVCTCVYMCAYMSHTHTQGNLYRYRLRFFALCHGGPDGPELRSWKDETSFRQKQEPDKLIYLAGCRQLFLIFLLLFLILFSFSATRARQDYLPRRRQVTVSHKSSVKRLHRVA
jgi:hypothetical protein